VIELNWTYRAKPVRVVDGDTIILLIDNGFYNREEHSIRLLGVDTPEIFSGPADERVRGQEAKSKTALWIAEAVENGPEWPLLIQTEKDKQTFGRFIAEVWSVASKLSLNAYLKQQGYGAT